MMNERIKKIVEETYVNVITTRGMTVVEDGCYIVSPDRLEKYTHAVVKECIQELEISKRCDPYTGVLFDCEHNTCIDEQIEMLKYHFGVIE